MTDPQPNRTEIDSLFNRLKRSEEITADKRQIAFEVALKWSSGQPNWPEFTTTLVDLVQRQDEELDLIRAENDSLKAAEEVEPTNEEWGQSACRWARLDEPTWHWLKAASAEAYRLAAERAKGNP